MKHTCSRFRAAASKAFGRLACADVDVLKLVDEAEVVNEEVLAFFVSAGRAGAGWLMLSCKAMPREVLAGAIWPIYAVVRYSPFCNLIQSTYPL